MKKLFSVKRMFHLLLVLAVMLVVASGTATFAHADDEKTDIGAGGDIKYLTSYVYPDGSSLKGEVRLVDTRDYHMLVNGTDVSFSAEDDGNGGYDLTVTALETSEKYTGSYTCKAEFIGMEKPVSKTTRGDYGKGTWTYLAVSEEGGWKDLAVLSYEPVSGSGANLIDLDDAFWEEAEDEPDGEVYCVLPGAFNGAANLKTAILGEIEYEPYMFVNCPQLASVNLVTEEFTANTKNESDIDPLHLGPIEATNTSVDGESVHKIILTVHRKAKWVYTDDDDRETTVLTMSQYCRSLYDEFYIMETNSDDFRYGNWLFRVTYEADGIEPSVFTVVKYDPPESNPSARNVTSLTLPYSVRYKGETYDMDEYDFDLETNVFDGLPELNTINTGTYRLTAPLANNCPKLTTIQSDYSSDPDGEEDYDEEIWQDDCENYGLISELQPLVNGRLDSQLSVEMNEDFEWTMYEPKRDEQGRYIDPEGNVVEDPDDADFTTYRMSQYCARFGYAFPGVEMSDCRLRINAHDSLAAIAGNGTAESLDMEEL